MLKMSLPSDIQATLARVLEDHAQYFNKYETHCLPVEVEEVEYKSRDGFIPYTNGGYTLSFMSDLSLASSSGSHPEVIKPFIKSSLKSGLEYFKEENPTFDETNENDPLWDAFYEYENEWMSESSEFWYQLRVLFFTADNYKNITGEDEIYIISGTNTDFSYGRDSGLQKAYDKTVKVSDLTPESIVELIQEAINAI